jgi:hypothetical protein
MKVKDKEGLEPVGFSRHSFRPAILSVFLYSFGPIEGVPPDLECLDGFSGQPS